MYTKFVEPKLWAYVYVCKTQIKNNKYGVWLKDIYTLNILKFNIKRTVRAFVMHVMS